MTKTLAIARIIDESPSQDHSGEKITLGLIVWYGCFLGFSCGLVFCPEARLARGAKI
jgi:hypothetical protein